MLTLFSLPLSHTSLQVLLARLLFRTGAERKGGPNGWRVGDSCTRTRLDGDAGSELLRTVHVGGGSGMFDSWGLMGT